MEGRVEIYCGQGRGKTSCAIGQCVKAAGQEKQIIMVQFLKGKETEELSFFKRLEPEVQLFRCLIDQGFVLKSTRDCMRI